MWLSHFLLNWYKLKRKRRFGKETKIKMNNNKKDTDNFFLFKLGWTICLMYLWFPKKLIEDRGLNQEFTTYSVSEYQKIEMKGLFHITTGSSIVENVVFLPKIVKDCQNCQKIVKIVIKNWPGHVSSSHWSNVSMVASL